MALEAMATAYRANNQYGDAARAYAELSDRFANQLDQFPADDAALARILDGTPPQTISWHGPVRLKTSKNPIAVRRDRRSDRAGPTAADIRRLVLGEALGLTAAGVSV